MLIKAVVAGIVGAVAGFGYHKLMNACGST